MQSNTIYIRNFHTSLQTKIPLYENEKIYTVRERPRIRPWFERRIYSGHDLSYLCARNTLLWDSFVSGLSQDTCPRIFPPEGWINFTWLFLLSPPRHRAPSTTRDYPSDGSGDRGVLMGIVKDCGRFSVCRHGEALRGGTNPPPESIFINSNGWNGARA